MWELVPGPEGLVNQPGGQSLDIGPDGTLWMNAGGRTGGLARFDDSGWTVFTEADGVEPWGGQGWIPTDLLTVAPDGSVWMNGNGARRLRWRGSLRRHDVDLVSVRVLRRRPRRRPRWQRLAAGQRGGQLCRARNVNTYVIRPEAGATTE